MEQKLFDFSGIKTVDYRNARYQGLLHSISGKRHGLGILLDDDINLYCSEWSQGALNGMTFIFLNNANYLYGQWKEGQPSGLNIFKTKQYILYSNFMRGEIIQQSIATNDSLNHLMVFDGESIMNPSVAQFKLSSEKVFEKDLFEDILINAANKVNLMIQQEDCTFLRYLTKLSRRYNQILTLNSVNGLYYFGYRNGLGFNFSYRGTHRLQILTIGHHTNQRLTEIGIKFHSLHCVEQGNFGTKEIISYNKYSQRPLQKCQIIFKNIHKKGLNFLNEYFDLKNNPMFKIEDFLQGRLHKKYQEIEASENECKMKTDKRGVEISKRQQFCKHDKEDYLKGAGPIINKLKMKLNKSAVSFERSKSKLKTQQTDIRPQINYGIFKHSTQQTFNRSQFDNEQRKEDPLQLLVNNSNDFKWKKEIKCQRCKSKEKRVSPAPNNGKVERIHGKSTEYIKNISPAKQAECRQQYNLSEFTQNNKFQNRYKNESGMSTHIHSYDQLYQEHSKRPPTYTVLKQQIYKHRLPNPLEQSVKENRMRSPYRRSQNQGEPLQRNKQQKQIQNQIRIRRQLHWQERDQNIKNKFAYYQNYPQSAFGIASQDELLNSYQNIPYSQTQQSQILNLQDRRANILKQFRRLNQELETESILSQPAYYFRPQYEEIKNHSPQRYGNSLATELIQSGRKMAEVDQYNRQKMQQFNKKYRNYLPQGQRLTNNIYRVNGEGYFNKVAQTGVPEPSINSFSYQGMETGQNQPPLLKRSVRKSKYQYYFE